VVSKRWENEEFTISDGTIWNLWIFVTCKNDGQMVKPMVKPRVKPYETNKHREF
jgi:hypothetical protein